MQGLPTIVVGLFVYGLIVIPQHKESGFAGAVALAIVMLPLMARSSQEVLLLVPGSLREAADALGVNRWRTVAHRDPAGRHRRDRHRRDPGHRPCGRRDRAAPDLRLAVQPRQHNAEPVPRRPQRPDVHLHVVSTCRCAAGRHPRLGRRARADDLDPPRQHRRARDRSRAAVRRWADDRLGPGQPDGRQISRGEMPAGRVRIRTEPCSRSPPADGQRRRDRARPRVVFDIRDMSVYYGEQPGPRPDHAEDLPQPRDRGDRSVGLRQVDVHPQPQPDERLDPRVPARAARSCTTATTCTQAAPTGSRSAAGSGWCSRSRIRSRSRSTTTSPGRRGTSG